MFGNLFLEKWQSFSIGGRKGGLKVCQLHYLSFNEMDVCFHPYGKRWQFLTIWWTITWLLRLVSFSFLMVAISNHQCILNGFESPKGLIIMAGKHLNLPTYYIKPAPICRVGATTTTSHLASLRHLQRVPTDLRCFFGSLVLTTGVVLK